MAQIIMEISSNHLGDKRLIEAHIRECANVGADYVKFQAYKAKNLNRAKYKTEEAYFDDLSYYKQTELTQDDLEFIISICEDSNIQPLFTVFDLDTIYQIRKLTPELVKIASPDLLNYDLIDLALESFEHVIISTGMHTEAEINQAIEYITIKNAIYRVTFMHCVSQYPAFYNNLHKIDSLKSKCFNVGYSDHSYSRDKLACQIAISKGIKFLEFHYAISNYLPSKDSGIAKTSEIADKIITFNSIYDMENSEKIEPEKLPFFEEMREKYIGRWGGNKIQ